MPNPSQAQQAPAAPAWHTTTQQETTALNDLGQWVPGVRVGWAADNGMAGTVFVPMAEYSAAKVRELVTARVQAAHEVGQLHG